MVPQSQNETGAPTGLPPVKSIRQKKHAPWPEPGWQASFYALSTFGWRRGRRGRGSLTLPRNGAHRVRENWRERFAETPDVLKSARLQQTIVQVLDLEIGGDEFITMAGPCSVETEFQLMATANHVRRAGARILRGGAFKPRSSPYAFQGLGLEGLKMLARAREESGLAIVTEVMSEDDVPTVAEYADILQIGSRNMENYSLLEAAAHSGRPMLLKRGMVATMADLLRSAQCILDNGNPQRHSLRARHPHL